jgi:hypothetical protein
LEETDVIVPDEKDFENEHRARMQNLRLTQFNSRYQPIVRQSPSGSVAAGQEEAKVIHDPSTSRPSLPQALSIK